MRIEIGYGLEGVITDAQSGKIIRNSIIPAFKNGDRAGGLQKGISDIDNRLTGNNLNDNTDRSPFAFIDRQRIFQNAGTNLLHSILLVLPGSGKIIRNSCLRQDHTVHIEIGYGLEGILTDAQSGKLYATVLFLRLKRAILLSACFYPLRQKVRDSMRSANRPSRYQRK